MAGLVRPHASPARLVRRARWILLAGLGALALLAPTASVRAGEPQRVEVVGAHPIRESERAKINPRDQAIEQALWEGVSRVARTLIEEEGAVASPRPEPGATDARTDAGGVGDSEPEAQSDASTELRGLFGSKILPYTRSFRIVEDRGERPVLFADDPGVRSEYVVVVDVAVDVDRVRAELDRAGLLAPRDAASVAQRPITLELVGIRHHAGLQRVLETLRTRLGVRSVEALEFAPARQVLRIEGPLGPDELARRLDRLDSAELILDPVEIDGAGGRVRVLAQWIEPLPEAGDGGAEGAPATLAP